MGAGAATLAGSAVSTFSADFDFRFDLLDDDELERFFFPFFLFPDRDLEPLRFRPDRELEEERERLRFFFRVRDLERDDDEDFLRRLDFDRDLRLLLLFLLDLDLPFFFRLERDDEDRGGLLCFTSAIAAAAGCATAGGAWCVNGVICGGGGGCINQPSAFGIWPASGDRRLQELQRLPNAGLATFPHIPHRCKEAANAFALQMLQTPFKEGFATFPQTHSGAHMGTRKL